MRSNQTPSSLLSSALKHVESKSIRDWATSANNKPIFLKIAEKSIERSGQVDPTRFATYIVATAIGL